MFKWICIFALLCQVAFAKEKTPPAKAAASSPTEKIVLAGGCFWCMEPPFDVLPGVKSTISGYVGGKTKNPTYKQVTSGKTGHTEAVEVSFDPNVISLNKIFDVYWMNFDPTDGTGSFGDRGSQYRPGIFYFNQGQKKLALASKKKLSDSKKFKKPIVVEVSPVGTFYKAEDYHQDYYKKNPKRYKFYRFHSGRDEFIEKHWGKKKGKK